MASFAELAVVGREGIGGGPINMVAGRGGKNAEKHSKEASMAAAKSILDAAGVNAAALSGQSRVEVGGKVVQVKKPALIPSPMPMLRALSSLAMGTRSTSNLLGTGRFGGEREESNKVALGHAPLGRRSSRLLGLFNTTNSSDKKNGGASGSISGTSTPLRSSIRAFGGGSSSNKGSSGPGGLSAIPEAATADVKKALRTEESNSSMGSVMNSAMRVGNLKSVSPSGSVDSTNKLPTDTSSYTSTSNMMGRGGGDGMLSDVCSESHVVIDSTSVSGSSSTNNSGRKRQERISFDTNPLAKSAMRTGDAIYRPIEDCASGGGGRGNGNTIVKGTASMTDIPSIAASVGKNTAVTSGVTIRSFVGLNIPSSTLLTPVGTIPEDSGSNNGSGRGGHSSSRGNNTSSSMVGGGGGNNV